MKNYIAYYRVSTKKQGASGLGLEAQKQTVKFHTYEGNVIESFTEVESGKKDKRPELEKAINMCKDTGATLVIAKLDRLSRNVVFIFNLRDSEVDFECCDLPEANTLTIGIFAVIAQHEREIISKRTKEALAAKKARGEKMGTPENLTDKATENSVKVRIEKALTNENNIRAYAMIKLLRANGKGYAVIANELNSTGFVTSTGKRFAAMQVHRIYKRFQDTN